MHLWVFSNLKNDGFPHVLKVHGADCFFFCRGGSAVTDSSCELVETKQGSESRKPLDDLGESFPELDKFVDSYQYYEGDRNILSGPGRFFTC